MHIVKRSEKAATVLKIEGRFEFATLEKFQSALKRVEETHPHHIILDLREVVSIDSAALARLVSTSHRLKQSSIQFTLTGQFGFVDSVLKEKNIHEFISTLASVEEALDLPPQT